MAPEYGSLSGPQDIAFARSLGQQVPEVEGYVGKKQVDWNRVFGSLCGPWLIFVLTYCFAAMQVAGSATVVLCVILLGVALSFGFMTIMAFRNGKMEDAFWFAFIFATALLWWTIAYMSGNSNYLLNFEPVNDVNQLNVYPNVDPFKYRGNQLMDAGIIQFTADSRVHLPYSGHFKNKEVYCAAPIISGPANSTLPDSFDFWAIGKNCCSGQIADFRCGGYQNAKAHSGLRLMNDADRAFYRLVVQQAAASFHIKAAHPLFVYWMEDPMFEINAYQDDGMLAMKNAICAAFLGQLLLTALVTYFSMKS